MKRAVFLCLAFLQSMAWAEESDVEFLRRELPPDFDRPSVRIYPLQDLRCLTAPNQEGTTAQVSTPPDLWDDFLEELKQAKNLKIEFPDQLVERSQKDKSNQKALEAVRKLANRGYADYREVRLDSAIETLRDALDGFYSLEHHHVDPREVARLALTLGLAELERGDEIAAASSFRETLQIDPCLRLRDGYDHPSAVQLFDRIRQELSLNPPEEQLQNRSGTQYVLQGRLLPNGDLSVSLQSGAGISRDRATPSPSAASRLASRIFTCLPFGKLRNQRRSRRHLYLDGGFGGYLFLSRPVEMFRNMGLTANANLLIDRFIGLEMRLGLFNSGRDRSENLRQDIPSFRLALGPSFQAQFRVVRLFSSVGIEFARIGKLVTSTNPACKYFSPEDHVPLSICNHTLDVHEKDASFHLGASLSAGIAFSLTDRLYAGLRTSITWYGYDSIEKDLDFPLGGQVFLGYRLF